MAASIEPADASQGTRKAAPPQPEPPARLSAFYWHFVSQAKGLLALLFVPGFVVSLLDATIPVFIGRVVTLIASAEPAASASASRSPA